MKIIRFLAHPLLILAAFAVLLVSGQSFGGPYFYYLALGLPHGAGYSLAGVTGIICLLVSLFLPGNSGKLIVRSWLIICGTLLLVLSLFLFFSGERLAYNEPTFYQAIPLLMLGIFVLLATAGIIISLKNLLGRKVIYKKHSL